MDTSDPPSRRPWSRLFPPLPFSSLVALLSNSLLSIASLVFINAATPFVLSLLLGIPSSRTGTVTGQGLLADELTALLAYLPAGKAADRWGVKCVAVFGHAVIAGALVLYVQARSVGELIAVRMLFAIGASSVVTTLSGLLTLFTSSSAHERVPLAPEALEEPIFDQDSSGNSDAERDDRGEADEETALLGGSRGGRTAEREEKKGSVGQLAGLMGFASGLGALLAVFGFLRLPTFFARHSSASPIGEPPAGDAETAQQALRYTFYVVAAVAAAESVLLALLLPASQRDAAPKPTASDGCGDAPQATRRRNSAGEVGKKVGRSVAGLFEGFRLATKSGEVTLGFLSSFASRAGAVIVTAYIPNFVNRYLTEHDLCDVPSALLLSATSPAQSCRRAYLLSSALTGVVQLLSLLLSPLVGYLSASPTLCSARNPRAAVLALSFLLGAASLAGFGALDDPTRGVAWAWAAGMGVAQAAGLVLSLALVTTGRHALEVKGEVKPGGEAVGALSGAYAMSGGLGILLVGSSAGWLFDLDSGAPFYLMAGVDCVVALGSAVVWLAS
ncbi:hypothetical protein JCM10207_000097 [Rhodosporidiobolus poonsookiae]